MKADTCIIISASEEWAAFKPHFPDAMFQTTPYGEAFASLLNGQNIVFLHGGWGKIAAAGSSQYAIDRWRPSRLINVGTCGGFDNHAQRGQVVLAKKTIVYDIIEQMGHFDDAIDHYSVNFDLSWLPKQLPHPVTIGTLVSADRDIVPGDIANLIKRYGAFAGDWESGAIAWVAKHNHIPCLILRTVSDLVDHHSGEAYGNISFFQDQCHAIMADHLRFLPAWLEAFQVEQ